MPNKKKVTQTFNSGINRRTSRRRGKPNEFYTLQNARLQERGNTFEVSRIEGFSSLSNSGTTFDKIYDTLFFQDQLVVFWYDTTTSKVHITFIDVKEVDPDNDFSFSAPEKDYAEIVLSDETIFLTRYDKQLNYYGGTWYLNNFISHMPTFKIENFSGGGSLDVDSYYWYKLRFVFRDGHTTKTNYPQYVQIKTNQRSVRLYDIEYQTDVDGDLANVEVFRKQDGGEFFLIKRFSPQNSTDTIIDDGLSELEPLDEQNYVWFDDAQAQEIVQNRLVKANIVHFDKDTDLDVDVYTSELVPITGGGPTVSSLDNYIVTLDGETITVDVKSAQTKNEVAQLVAISITIQSAKYNASVSGNVVTITAKQVGLSYNGTITTTPNNTTITDSDTNLTGGVDSSGDAQKASGSITITAAPDNTKQGTQSTVTGSVNRSGTGGGEAWDVNVSFDGINLPVILADSAMGADIVAGFIVNALNNDSIISQNWNFISSGNASSATITGKSLQNHSSNNGKTLSINGHPDDNSLPAQGYILTFSGGTSSGGVDATINDFILTLDGFNITVPVLLPTTTSETATAFVNAVNDQTTLYVASINGVNPSKVDLIADQVGSNRNGNITTTPGNTGITTTDTELTGGQANTTPGSKATGTLTITAGSATVVGQATAQIEVLDVFGSDDFTLETHIGATVAGTQTVDPNISNPATIATIIASDINSNPDWSATVSNGTLIDITSVNGGIQYNGVHFYVRSVPILVGGQFPSQPSGVVVNDDFSSGGGTQDDPQGLEGKQPTLPPNTRAKIYGQVLYKDGTFSPHIFLDDIQTGSDDLVINYDFQNIPVNLSEISEISFYAKYESDNQENTIDFNSLEIYNKNVPSLATKFDTTKDTPANPHIFLGYKYVMIKEENISGGTSDKEYYIYDQDWNFKNGSYVGTNDSDTGDDDKWILKTETNTTAFSGNSPDEIDLDLVGRQKYKLKFKTENSAPITEYYYIYELSILEPLNAAVSENVDLKIALKDASVNLSDSKTNNNFLDVEASIVGILDTSLDSSRQVYGAVNNTPVFINYIRPTAKNHIYLILESASVYDDFDNEDANNDGVLVSYDDQQKPDLTSRYIFSIINVSYDGITSTDSDQIYGPLPEVTQKFFNTHITKKNEIDLDELLYLGQINADELTTTTDFHDGFGGFKTISGENFTYTILLEAAIFKQIIKELENVDIDNPNQILFSEPNIPNSNVGGFRNFEFDNIKNISGNYGEIVRISYFQGKLYVFCERGLNIILVGEVLTQQLGGQVFVNSSNFLNSSSWILTNVQEMQPDSVVQYENLLFFCDGKDVWLQGQSLDNISAGAIPIDHTKEIKGSIDPKNKEYLLTVGSQTWVYSIELQQWQGPYTYEVESTSPFKDNFYGIVGTDAVKFNDGNDFNGTPYDTIIESIGNDLNAPLLTKRFRKFYIEAYQDGDFYWGKDPNVLTSRTLSTLPNKNGIIYSGVNPENVNGQYLYWKIETDQQGFLLSSIGFMYNPRNRR